MYPERGSDMNIMLARFNLLSLQERRTVASILFVVKLLRGNIDCPQFLGILPLRVPKLNSRSQVLFYLPPLPSSGTVGLPCPLRRSCEAANAVVKFCNGSIDLLTTPLSEISRVCFNYMVSLRH